MCVNFFKGLFGGGGGSTAASPAQAGRASTGTGNKVKGAATRSSISADLFGSTSAGNTANGGTGISAKSLGIFKDRTGVPGLGL